MHPAATAANPAKINYAAEAPEQLPLFKAELIRHKGPWKGIDDVEIATAEYLDWFNHRRLHGQIGLIPPAELEADHAGQQVPTTAAAPAATSQPTLH